MSLDAEPALEGDSVAAGDYALVGYPLSSEFRARFERTTASAPTYLGIPELRRMKPAALVKFLLGLRVDRLFIPVEEPSSRAFLPIFYCLASLVRARQVEVVWPDLERCRTTRWQNLRSIAAVPPACIGGQSDLHRTRRELARLGRTPRIAARQGSGGVLYLKCNLWAGVRAGGAVGHVAGVINALAARGMPVDFAGLDPPLGTGEAVRRLRLDPLAAYAVPYELNLYRFQHACTRQISRQAAADYRFIYQRLSIANYTGVTLSRARKLPLVIEYNSSEVWAAMHWGAGLRYHAEAVAAEEACLRHAHVVITVSRVLGEELVDRGVEPERIVVYPNGIDPGVFDPAAYDEAQEQQLRRELGIAPDAVVAAFAGTFSAWHGLEVLAQAIRQLATTDPEWLRARKLHFLLLGDGAQMPLVRQLLDNALCRPFVTLTGLVPQAAAPRHLALADVLLSPHVADQERTRFFGSPTKLFEYMALGKAIVASDLEQIGEVLRHSLRADQLPSTNPPSGESRLAVLAEPGSVDQLTRAIRFLVDHPAWRGALGANARAEALSRYTWAHHVDAILERLTALC